MTIIIGGGSSSRSSNSSSSSRSSNPINHIISISSSSSSISSNVSVVFVTIITIIIIITIILITANPRTNIVGFRGSDSSIILILRGGIPRPKGNFPESLSQAILVGTMLAGRLGIYNILRYATT